MIRRSCGFGVMMLVLLILLISGCSSVTEDDLADLQSNNYVMKKEAIGRIAKGPAFPLRLIRPLVRRGNEKEAVTLLLELLSSGSEDREEQINILKALGKLGKTTKVPAGPLLEKLKEKNHGIRRRAIEVLAIAKSREAVPALKGLLDEEKDKYDVIWALGEIGDPSTVVTLNRLLASSDQYDRYNAQRALRKIEVGMASGKAPSVSSRPMEQTVQSEQASYSPVSGAGPSAAGDKRGDNFEPKVERTKRAGRVARGSAEPTDRVTKQIPSNKPGKAVPATATSPAHHGDSSPTRERPRNASKGPGALALAMTQTSAVVQKPSDPPTGSGRQPDAQGGKEARVKRASAPPKEAGGSEKATALYLQGLAFHREGNLKEALKMYEAAIRVYPDMAPAWNNIGTIRMKEKNYGSAVIAFQKALRIVPDDADPYYNLACLYSLQKNLGRSLSYLQKAVSVDENARKWALADDDLKNLRSHSEFQRIVHAARNS